MRGYTLLWHTDDTDRTDDHGFFVVGAEYFPPAYILHIHIINISVIFGRKIFRPYRYPYSSVPSVSSACHLHNLISR